MRCDGRTVVRRGSPSWDVAGFRCAQLGDGLNIAYRSPIAVLSAAEISPWLAAAAFGGMGAISLFVFWLSGPSRQWAWAGCGLRFGLRSGPRMSVRPGRI